MPAHGRPKAPVRLRNERPPLASCSAARLGDGHDGLGDALRRFYGHSADCPAADGRDGLGVRPCTMATMGPARFRMAKTHSTRILPMATMGLAIVLPPMGLAMLYGRWPRWACRWRRWAWRCSTRILPMGLAFALAPMTSRFLTLGLNAWASPTAKEKASKYL